MNHNSTIPHQAGTFTRSVKKVLGMTFIMLATFFNVALAQNQQFGSIQGTVTTSDGKPADFVTVGVTGTNIGTLTNEKGFFKINRVKAGSYTLKVSGVGITAQEKQVSVNAGSATSLDFVLDISDLKLQEVEIKDRNNRIKVDHPSQSLRLQEPLLNIPQNIQVISNQSISDQQIISMSDGLIRNVSGAVRLEHWGDMYTNITMRGSQIQAFRNGFNVVNSYWGPLTEDMSYVDHIEFIKGPAGFMLGNGDPSGLYNVVTKKPTGQTKGEFSFTTGSFGLYRSSLDLDGKLSKDGKLLYRLNVAGQSKGSFRPNEFNNRVSVAPVISYQIDDDTKLTAEYVYQRANMSNVGSFYIFDKLGYARQPREHTMLPAGIPSTNINDHSFTVNFQHNFNPEWKITAQAAYYAYDQLGSSMWVDSVAANNTFRRYIGLWQAKSNMTLAQAFLNGKFTTGPLQHKLLTGIDMGTKEYLADWGQSHQLDNAARMYDHNTPATLAPAPGLGYPNFDISRPLESRAVQAGGVITQTYSSLYAQDVIGFFNDRLRVTLAGRYTYVKQAYGAELTGKKFTPRIGFSFSVDNQTSVYGLYDQAFIPQAAARLNTGGTAKPITGSNLEFGIKKDWGTDGKWNTTVAVYQIVKNNEAQADFSDPNSTPNNPVYFLLGQKKARGIEFDLRGELAPGLNLTANYALTDSRVSKLGANMPANSGIVLGSVVPGYAKHTSNVWLTYKIQSGVLKGSGISSGFTHLADRETDSWSVGLQKLPNTFKLDGGLFWEGKKVKIIANAFNILDAYTYTGSYYSWSQTYYYQADAPRNYRLSMSYRF